MLRRVTPAPLCAALFLALSGLYAPRAASASHPAAQPDPTKLLQLADRAMQSVHSLHTSGRHTSADRSLRFDATIVGDCASTEQSHLPVQIGTWVRGSYAQTGKAVQPLDSHYVLAGQVSPPTGRAWWRSAGTHNAWKPVPFGELVDQAYARQICPSLIRAAYLHSYLAQTGRSIQRQNLGLQTIQGYSTWHVREVLGFTLDFYVDAHSYQLRRLILSGSLGTTWQQTFDYSRFNQPIGLKLPTSNGK